MSRARIGLSVPPQLPPTGLPAYARRAETAGFDELWLAEDCFFAGGVAAASAALAASLFHFGELTIPQVREYLKSRGVCVKQIYSGVWHNPTSQPLKPLILVTLVLNSLVISFISHYIYSLVFRQFHL